VDELGTANLGSALIPGSPAAGGQIVQEAAQQAAPERSTFDRILDAARVVSESNVFGDIASGFNPQGGQNTGFGAGLARAGQLMAATRGRRSARAVAEQEALAKAQTAAARQQAAQTAAAKEARAASAAKSPAGKVMDDFNAGLIDEQTRDQQLQKFQDPTFVRKMESIDEREASGEIDAAEAIELRNKAIASGGTTVSVGTEGETAREKKQGQLIAQSQFDNMQSIQESGRTAGTQLRKLDTMESLLLAKQTEGEKGGFGTEAITTISGMLRGPLGLPDTVVDRLLSKEGQTRNEMIRSISKEMAIAQHTSGLGPMSDKDLAAFEAIVPGLDKSTEGSLQILNLMRTAAKAQQRNAVFLREWQSRPENRNKLPGPQFEAELEEFRDNNRLFVNDKSENVGALAKAGKIHPGTVIMDTSGNLVTLTEDHIKTLRGGSSHRGAYGCRGGLQSNLRRSCPGSRPRGRGGRPRADHWCSHRVRTGRGEVRYRDHT
jgi:hypothetical protein